MCEFVVALNATVAESAIAGQIGNSALAVELRNEPNGSVETGRPPDRRRAVVLDLSGLDAVVVVAVIVGWEPTRTG